MPVTLRSVKGSTLTHAELDANFTSFMTLSGGNITEIFAPNFNSTSDVRKKDNIETIQDSIEKVKQLRGVSFTWKDTNKPSLGVIAQETENVIPELVTTHDDGFKSVSYGNLVGLLIEAIKEQQIQIETLKDQINSLTNKG